MPWIFVFKFKDIYVLCVRNPEKKFTKYHACNPKVVGSVPAAVRHILCRFLANWTWCQLSKMGFIIFSSHIFFLNKLFLQIELSPSNALETLKIAVELDLSKLISKCEEYFLKELSVENCCEFYMDAMNIGGGGLVSTCQSFIEQNASDVVPTQEFLNLSKDALIQLISSDKVTILINFDSSSSKTNLVR